MAVKISFSQSGWTSSISAVYIDTSTGTVYSDSDCTTEIDSVPVPTRTRESTSGFRFLGYYSTNAATGTQYIDSDGKILDSLRSLTAARAIYCPSVVYSYKVVVNANGGSGGTASFWRIKTAIEEGVYFYADQSCENAIDSIDLPTYDGYYCTGLWDSASGTTQYVDMNGRFLDALATYAASATRTIYAQWADRAIKITLSQSGWTSGTTAIYRDVSTDKVYSDSALTTEIDSVSIPTRTITTVGYRFLGYYSTNATTGTQYIDADGKILDALRSVTSATTIYCPSVAFSYRVAVSANGGSGGTEQFWRIAEPVTEGVYFYSEWECENAITSVTMPTRTGYNCTGLWVSTTGTTQYVSSNGAIIDALATYAASAARTIYAQWSGKTYTLTFNYNGGTGKTASKTVTYGSEVGTLPSGTLSGYRLSAWKVNGAAITESTVWSIDGNATAVAAWTKVYLLNFDYNGGTGSVAYKQLAVGDTIGTLPTATRSRAEFVSWQIDGVDITSSTVWSATTDKTAKAVWSLNFGSVNDYFGLASDSLIPESSCGNTDRHYVTAYNATSEEPGTQLSIVIRNPTVTYRVVKDMTLSVTLGKGYAGTLSDAGKLTRSGYMITSVEVRTAIGEPPTVTISSAANEGYVYSSGTLVAQATDAVQTYPVSFTIKARHRPQNILSAFTGGGALQECTTVATCDPVVVEENSHPCASDVVHGKYEVTARLNVYNGEADPAVANSFIRVRCPSTYSGTGYLSKTALFVKEM